MGKSTRRVLDNIDWVLLLHKTAIYWQFKKKNLVEEIAKTAVRQEDHTLVLNTWTYHTHISHPHITPTLHNLSRSHQECHLLFISMVNGPENELSHILSPIYKHGKRSWHCTITYLTILWFDRWTKWYSMFLLMI